MAQKYSIAAQSSGFISFRKPILDDSDYTTGSTYKLIVPDGMISIGDNGRGFTINASTVTLSSISNSSEETYVLYASAPSGGDPQGIAIVETSAQTFASYTGASVEGTRIFDGDDAGRRAIASFKTRLDTGDSKYKIDPSSIQTVSNFDYKNFSQFTQEYGLYTSKTDPDFEYRGQNVDIDAALDVNVQDLDIVYWDGSAYQQAVGDDTTNLQVTENVVGIARRDRAYKGAAVAGKNVVISSGFIDIGVTRLPNTIFPVNTKVYLSDAVAGAYAREFDTRTNNKAYILSDQIIETGASGIFVFECFTAGTSDPSLPVDFINNITTVWKPGDTAGSPNSVTDGGVEWRAIAEYSSEYQSSTRKIRIGTSLGNGLVLLSGAGSSNIDDHDDSSGAHPSIQTALNKAGIYVDDELQGKTVIDYKGQYFDEKAVFQAGVVSGNVVYMYKTAGAGTGDGTYDKAVVDDSTSSTLFHKYAVGIASRVAANEGFVISTGFVDYDTDNIDLDGGTLDEGSEIFLSDTTAGNITLKRTKYKLGNVTKLNDGGYNPSVDTTGQSGIILLNPSIDYRNILEANGISLEATNGTYSYSGSGIYLNPTFEGGVSDNELVYVTGTGTFDQAAWVGSNPPAASENVVGVGDVTNGRIVSSGFYNLDTTSPGYDEGEVLYLSMTTPGAITNIFITGSNMVKIGQVIKLGTTDGLIFINIDRYTATENSQVIKKATELAIALG